MARNGFVALEQEVQPPLDGPPLTRPSMIFSTVRL